MYCGITNIPEPFAVGNGDFFHYSPTSAFWIFNQVNNFSYLRYSDMIVDIQKAQSELENKFIALQPAIEKTAIELTNENNSSLAKLFLNEYSVSQANITLQRWQKLSQELLVKYMDGNIKDANNNVLHPEYPNWWYRAIINQTGDKFKMKKIE